MGVQFKTIARLIVKEEDDNVFQYYHYQKNEIIDIGSFDENSIFFIMSGEILINDFQGTKKVFEAGSMYFLSKNYAPYKGIVNKTATCVELKSDNLLPYIEQVLLFNIIAKYTPDELRLDELEIKKPLRYFLSEIIYYKNGEFTSKSFFHLKKMEWLFIMRKFYSKDLLARFFSPTVLNESKFRMTVFAKYTDKITVKELSEECCMTTKTFTRHFKTEFNTTPLKWLMMQKIKSLNYTLVYDTLPLDEILDKYNFKSDTELLEFCCKNSIKFNMFEYEYV